MNKKSANMKNLKNQILKLEGIELYNQKKTLKFKIELLTSKAFSLNLFFKDDSDKEVFVKEYFIKEKFLPYYPHSLKIINYVLLERNYKPDNLVIVFELNYEDYVNHIYEKIESCIFNTVD